MCFKMHTIKASIISHHWRLTCTIIQSFKSNLSLYPLQVQVLADQSPNNEYQFKETITEFVCQNALPNQSTYELTNLNPNTYYEVRIRANNVHGLSESSLYIFKTKGAPSSGFIGNSASLCQSSLTGLIFGLFTACLAVF